MAITSAASDEHFLEVPERVELVEAARGDVPLSNARTMTIDVGILASNGLIADGVTAPAVKGVTARVVTNTMATKRRRTVSMRTVPRTQRGFVPLP